MPAGDFVRGAIGGFEFVDNQFRQNEQDKQRRMAIQTNDQRYAEQKARQSRLDSEQAANSQLSRQATQQNMAIQQQTFDGTMADRAFDRERTHQQDTISAQDRERQETERQRQRLIEENNFFVSRFFAGGSEPPLEHEQKLEAAGLSAHSLYRGFARPQEHQAELQVRGILERVGSGDLDAVNQPEALQVLNTVYAGEIRDGIGEFNQQRGAKIVDKRIAGFETGPGGKFAAMIEVTLEDGQKYIAPRTRNRSSDPNDEVMLIDPGKAMNDLMGRHQMALIRERSSPAIKQQWDAMNGRQPVQDEYEFRQVDGGFNEAGEKVAPVAGRFNKRTGAFEPFDAPASAEDPLQTPDGIREAFQRGEITKEQANEMYQSL